MVVYLINTSGKPIEAKSTVTVAPALTLSESQFTCTVPAASVVTRTIPLPDLARQSVRSTATVKVAWQDYSTVCTVLLAPPVLNGDFETQSNGDHFADAWGTYSGEFFGTLVRFAVDAPAPVKGCDGELDHEIKHGGKASLKLRGQMKFTFRDMAGTALANDPGFIAASHRPILWNPDVTQSVVLKANTEYRLTLWLRVSAKPCARHYGVQCAIRARMVF